MPADIRRADGNEHGGSLQLQWAIQRLADLRKQRPPTPVNDCKLQRSDGAVRWSRMFGAKADSILVHNPGADRPCCTMRADGYPAAGRSNRITGTGTVASGFGRPIPLLILRVADIMGQARRHRRPRAAPSRRRPPGLPPTSRNACPNPGNQEVVVYAFNSRLLDRGTCTLCGLNYAAKGITRHLQSCIPKTMGGTPVKVAPGAMAGADKTRYMQLKVTAALSRDYWLHLGIRADATLEELDFVLRELWLECCDHLSAFVIHRETYLSPWGIPDPWEEDLTMDVAIGTVLPHRMPVEYTYDFGSSTKLFVESTNLYALPSSGEDTDTIQVLARNHEPLLVCDVCSSRAQYMEASDGRVSESGHFCEDHLPVELSYLYPILNSPRSGVCSYGW